VAAHAARIFMWDLDLRRDVVPGDELKVTWKMNGAEPEIAAASYLSQKQQRTLRAYRFQDPADTAPSYWSETGVELARRLKQSPLRDYEQITALLKDRPTHQGMDFKTPVGTAVYAPRAGVISRIDWKRKGNGRCVELRYADGVMAKFLHLSAIKVASGAHVEAGQLLALSGNTGHSTAPHLHYQLNRGTQTLDPVDYHGTLRRHLSGAALTAFKKELARVDATCP
jgi:murein DD-endopeptidase